CVLLRLSIPAFAHNPDTSYARVRIFSDRLELRFTYDLFTLLRVVHLDDRGARLITRAELKRRAPEIFAWLRTHIALEVDERVTGLGDTGTSGWAADAGESIPEQDYHSPASA